MLKLDELLALHNTYRSKIRERTLTQAEAAQAFVQATDGGLTEAGAAHLLGLSAADVEAEYMMSSAPTGEFTTRNILTEWLARTTAEGER